MATQPRSSQIKNIAATSMIGSASLDTLDTIFPKIDAELSKLFEDRNFILADGGTIAVNAGATSVTFTASLKLHVNSLVAGGAPKIIDLASTTRAFTADGNMLYAVINRTAGTATVTADSSTLPSVVFSNQEVVLIAKRIGTVIYFRNGVTIPASATRTMDGNIFTTNNLTINSVHSEGTSNDTATGSNVTLTSPATPIVRLTAAGTLVSVDMIPAGVSGQSIKVVNATGSAININNETGATAANRILTGTSGTLSLANNASIILTYDGTSARWRVIGGSGSGSGGSGINYILSPGADTGAAGWVTYADAAGVSPVDGTGGSPVVTFTTTATTPIRGLASFLITKDAANRQGNGVSYDFTIDSADKGKVLQGSFEYQIASGAFADNDISVWIYDITNGVMIQPAPYLLKNSGLIEKFPIEFQTSINSTSYRLIFHVASTSALAYSIKMDTVTVGPQAKLYGSAVTDWVSYTPANFNGFGSTSAINIQWRRQGDSVQVRGIFTTTSPTAAEARVSLPTGLTIDSTKITATQKVGEAFASGSTNPYQVHVMAQASQAYLNFSRSLNSASPSTLANANDIWASGNTNSFYATVPITGWSSSQVMSSDADTRVVGLIVNTATRSITGANSGTTNAILQYSNVVRDTHGAYSTVTGQYTVPIAGMYRVSALNFVPSVSGAWGIAIFQNGSLKAIGPTMGTVAINAANFAPVEYLLDCKAGDTIDIRGQVNSGSTSITIGNNSTVQDYMCIERLTGPSQIMASESVNASYYLSASQASSTSLPIKFDVKEWDSHGAYSTSTGKFTAPSAGLYQVSGYWSSVTLNEVLFLFKNGVIYKAVGYVPNAPGGRSLIGGKVKLLAGETIDLRTEDPITVLGGSLATNTTARVEIERIGNY